MPIGRTVPELGWLGVPNDDDDAHARVRGGPSRGFDGDLRVSVGGLGSGDEMRAEVVRACVRACLPEAYRASMNGWMDGWMDVRRRSETD